MNAMNITDTALRIADLHLFKPEPLDTHCIISRKSEVFNVWSMEPPKNTTKQLFQVELQIKDKLFIPVFTPIIPCAALVRFLDVRDARFVLFEEVEHARAISGILNMFQDVLLKQELTSRMPEGSCWFDQISKANRDLPQKNHGNPCTLRVIEKN